MLRELDYGIVAKYLSDGINKPCTLKENNMTGFATFSGPGPGCYPEAIREAKETKKILTLAESVVHDQTAQKFLTKEILKFISSITKK
jgi:hypothetical protein